MQESVHSERRQCQKWDPEARGVTVHVRNRPGKLGRTTGRTKMSGSHLMVEVEFGPNEKSFKRFAVLDRQAEQLGVEHLIREGRFGGADDLRRILVLEKVKGELTNIIYSMDSGLTEFYPHQFKPVLRFLESHTGRLLIADEVGLGKTVEAAYIWKELEARESARRLLVVCPAMLREKWKSDLKRLFGISSQIVNAKGLLEELQGDWTKNSFAFIASMQSIRPPRGYNEENDQSSRSRLGRFLEQNQVTDFGALFDLAVIDEAHYMRNAGTSVNVLGGLLRESARHFVLLTATPVQIRSENLFRLLQLIDPDEFNDIYVFGEMLRANSRIVLAQQALWRRPVDISLAQEQIRAALATDYFEGDQVLKRILEELPAAENGNEDRVRLANMLETRSLLWQYMTRSRKREVLERSVERSPQTLTVEFSEEEKSAYESLSNFVQGRILETGGIWQFALVLRQRQMASSIVAALNSWRSECFTDGDQLEEMFLDDIGYEAFSKHWQQDTSDSSKGWLGMFSKGFDLRQLEQCDSKYNKLKNFLGDTLTGNPREKIVVFAYFRATLDYLERRLNADGIRAVSIMGGRGDENEAAISSFRDKIGPNVLLSSEVGSEGIDLQFCRMLVNYDLPWNPMQIEQRIGRLDRLGQRAEKISIVNLSVKDSVEERILTRLYDRIALFKESIGELEPILGDKVDELLGLLLSPVLSPTEREQKAEEVCQALENIRAQQRELEDNAADLVGLSDIILQQVDDARQRGHWLSGEDLHSLVEDYFSANFRGTRIEPVLGKCAAARIMLSMEAKAGLSNFIRHDKPSVHTQLHLSSSPILCLFGSRQEETPRRGSEFVEVGHPLIRWIRSQHETSQMRLHKLSAVEVESAQGVPKGEYAFAVQIWSFDGLRKERILAYSACEISLERVLNPHNAEELVTAGSNGLTLPNALNALPPTGRVISAIKACEKDLDQRFSKKSDDFEAQNDLKCSQQLTSARRSAVRRMARPKELRDKFEAENNLRMYRLYKGRVDKIKTHLCSVEQRIEEMRVCDPTFNDLAWGAIRVLR